MARSRKIGQDSCRCDFGSGSISQPRPPSASAWPTGLADPKTALANYVVNSDPHGVDHGLASKPLLAFAVCYVTAHLALNLVNEKQAEAILNYCEEQLEKGS